ncbi:ABC transporter ATP-binding protein [Kitasatospora sp. MMS16-BH015]|uniref:ABC transporter ATP-binding protein n=1 Tax=Kitasatospora sp. MMS16-BH015 TaxID=2018025 RepID=UPI000CA2ACF9|nr:ABC transporter ATP-binding protein [Kitasatospora sp. MMS16-BH015]AUG79505.1 ABC transporter ATP-binding protein [Kitasatospora sp. MMS16-BH015]
MTTLAKSEGTTASGGSSSFLSVRDLSVRFSTEDGVVRAVDNLSFEVEAGTTLGIVGESGSGKSVTNLAILGLHNPVNTEIGGSIKLQGQELVGAPNKELEKLRGHTMSMIFQDPLTALSPFHTIGKQIGETFQKHTGASKSEARDRAIEMLTKVGIPQPKTRVDNYPHQFSGGMRQRAMIAMSLVCNPALVIADEPTTALDVTVQAQILDLLKDLQQEMGTAIILITHDLGVVARTAQNVMVMYAGRAVERGTVREVLKTPQHPYTWGLLSSMPSLSGPVDVPLTPVRGTPPSLINLPTGCPFNPRCDHMEKVVGGKCTSERPPLAPQSGHATACHLSAGQKQDIFIDQIQPRLG